MVINIDSYRVNKVGLQHALARENYGKDRKEVIAEFSAGSRCPLIAVICYAAELQGGFDEELKDYAQKIIAFYHYVRIDGVQVPHEWFVT